MAGEKRPVLKFSKPLYAVFSKLYGIDVTSEEEFLMSSLHRGCSQKIERAYKKVVKNSPGVSIPQLKEFMSRRQRKCTGCNKYNTCHNSSSCPDGASSEAREKRKNLMDLSKREQ